MAQVFEITGNLVIDHRAREWCKLPYPDHPKGCPNYGNQPHCPPQAPLIENWLDLSKSHWLIITDFDVSAFAFKMKEKHPDWTDKQCRCVLYWQNIPRRALRDAIKNFQKSHPDTIFTLLPEAMGVHVIASAKRVGIPIEAKPNGTVYKIALVGYAKDVLNSFGCPAPGGCLGETSEGEKAKHEPSRCGDANCEGEVVGEVASSGRAKAGAYSGKVNP